MFALRGVSLEYRTDPSASQLVPEKVVLECARAAKEHHVAVEKFDLLSSGFSDPELDVIEWCLRPGMFSFKTRRPWKRAGGDNFNLQGFPEMCQKEHYPDPRSHRCCA